LTGKIWRRTCGRLFSDADRIIGKKYYFGAIIDAPRGRQFLQRCGRISVKKVIGHFVSGSMPHVRARPNGLLNGVVHAHDVDGGRNALF
jgi:hypothetical protein